MVVLNSFWVSKNTRLPKNEIQIMIPTTLLGEQNHIYGTDYIITEANHLMFQSISLNQYNHIYT